MHGHRTKRMCYTRVFYDISESIRARSSGSRDGDSCVYVPALFRVVRGRVGTIRRLERGGEHGDTGTLGAPHVDRIA